MNSVNIWQKTSYYKTRTHCWHRRAWLSGTDPPWSAARHGWCPLCWTARPRAAPLHTWVSGHNHNQIQVTVPTAEDRLKTPGLVVRPSTNYANWHTFVVEIYLWRCMECVSCDGCIKVNNCEAIKEIFVGEYVNAITLLFTKKA